MEEKKLEEQNKKAKKDGQVSVISTPPFKLKQKVGRNWQAINMMKQFGFLPETIIVEKHPQGNNIIIVRAVVPEHLVAKEYKEIKAKITGKE